MTISRRQILLVCAVIGSTMMNSVSAQSDTLVRSLSEVQVEGYKPNNYVKSLKGASVVSMELMREMPRLLGNADPLHYANLLPGVQTNSEFDAGLHIQGCDNSHNQVSINGVPLYNVSHLLGFFSIFNATHFAQMQLAKSATSASSPNRIGGTVDMMTHDSITTALHGDISVGPLSSQGTVRIPIAKHTQLTLSAREAYINLLYSKWLTFDGEQTKYSFGDYNISLLSKPNASDAISVDAYLGHDNAGVSENSYNIDATARWGNAMASVGWRHVFPNKNEMKHSLYATGYRNRIHLGQTNFNENINSDIFDIGYKGSLNIGRLSLGIDIARHDMQPQNPTVTGIINGTDGSEPRQSSLEASLYVGYVLPIGERTALEGGLRSSMYRAFDDASSFYAADPNATFRWRVGKDATLSAHVGVKHQYLFQTGFSGIGLPTEFWFSANHIYKPQYSYNTSIAFDTYLFEKEYHVSAELYYKRLHHQVEYNGNVFDFVYSSYNLNDALLHGNGRNYGLNLMVEKRRGRITGWISYSVGRALRRFDGEGYEGDFPASHERIHELNAVATYRLNRHWSFGATFVAASGTPYTKVERFYLISNHVMADYGRHNGSRVNPYVRLDLSVCYDFKNKNGKRSGLNFSLYNATMHENVLMYRLKVSKERVAYRPFTFAIKMLPSINYYCNF